MRENFAVSSENRFGQNERLSGDGRRSTWDDEGALSSLSLDSLKAQARILVIDDEPVNCFLLEEMFAEQDFQNVKSIYDSRQALAVYDAYQPDVTLLDVRMPHIDGYDVMRGIAARNDLVPAPVIFLTAESSRENLLRAFRCGARDFLAKPFDLEEAIIRVVSQLEMHFAKKELLSKNMVLDEAVRARTADLERSRLDVINHLSTASEYRDEETGDHIRRMSMMCARLAETIGWSNDACDLILNASKMHDVGKIGVPDGILLKPGPLTSAELVVMRTHAAIGADILKDNDSPLMTMAWEIASAHHEWWDGSGYPKGLRADEIPQSARIAALADVYDALRSKRPYKEPWSRSDAAAEIMKLRSKQFEPSLTDAFLDDIDAMEDIRAQHKGL